METIVAASNREEALKAAVGLLRERGAGGFGVPAVLLVEDRSAIEDALIVLARDGMPLGVEVMTAAEYLEDRWALYGDGRRFPDDATRLVGCRRALAESTGQEPSVGLTALAVGLVSRAMGEVLAAVRADAGEARFAPEEAVVLHAAASYAEGLKGAGMVEPSLAWDVLAQADVPEEAVIAVDVEEGSLPAAAQRYFTGRGAVQVENLREKPRQPERAPELENLLTALYRPDPAHPVEATGALRFAFASGVSAQNQLLAQLADGPSTVIVSTDPAALYAAVSERLLARGLSVSLECPVAVGETDLGRLLAQWAALLDPTAPVDADLVSDAAFNRFGSVSKRRAFAFEKDVRADRLLSGDDLTALYYAELSAPLKNVFDLFREGRLADGVEAMQAHIAATTADGVARATALGTLANAEALARAAEADGMAYPPFAALLAEMSVSCRAAVFPKPANDAAADGMAGTAPSAEGAMDVAAAAEGDGNMPDVRIMGLSRCASLRPASVRRVVFGNMNAEERPMRATDTALTTLLEKLGANTCPDPLAHMRRRYHDALEAPRVEAVLARSLYNAKAEPTYPSTLYQETVDPYRVSLVSDAGMVAPWDIPVTLRPWAVSLAETSLVYAATGLSEQPAGLVVEQPLTGEVSPQARGLIVLPRTAQDAGLPGLDLSPSQVESYLGCPYNWFVNRRLRLNVPDEGFDAMERGTFVHRVLQEFHARLRESGIDRVTEATLPQARAAMTEVFEQRCREEGMQKPGNRYVPVDAHEEEERHGLLSQLLAFVDSQAEFLPGFKPAFEEWEYGKDGTTLYGHHRLTGTVDRIDVDGRGNAVVIDYKTGSLTGYGLGEASLPKGAESADSREGAEDAEPLPRRMQALMYARVVERELGLKVVGALYLNPLKQTVSGIYDATVLGPQDIPGIGKGNGMGGEITFGDASTFSELLEQAERETDRRLVSLEQGDIAPRPLDKDVCTYCPAVLCEKRLS